MVEKINIYCDESCHIENDGSPVMVLGCVWLPENKVRSVTSDIRNIKEQHGFTRNFEFKWTQISPSKVNFYKDIVKYFFDNENLHFRAMIALKEALISDRYNNDEMYYIVYYYMLIYILNKENAYNIYIDIKEEKRGGKKSENLRKVLSNKLYDFSYKRVIKKLQIIRSEESEILQLADLMIGALGYLNRGLPSDSAKGEVVKFIKSLSGGSLKLNSLPSESKFNLYYWKGRRN